jgi:polysaccharide deacetylase family protein (PEP-CTERM system associated)
VTLSAPTLTPDVVTAAAPARTMAAPLTALSIDVEEYFHAEVFARQVPPADWDSYPRRAAAALERIAVLLERSESKATFFVLTWGIDAWAPLLRHLASQGHEIACHGHAHQHLSRLSPADLRADLERSRGLLEDRVGVRPAGYRAPTFSVMHPTAWALDAIIDAGFEYDASIFPVRHDRYGIPDAPTTPFHAISPSGRSIVEVPPLTLGPGPARLPLGGGGYLRLLPVQAFDCALRWRRLRGQPAVLYLHPWELDPQQPRLPAGRLATWRHRVNLAGTERKLGYLLNQFRFDTVQRVARAWSAGHALPSYRLGG